jgi:predicted  nucleic acid-binding Zn-ribbon protein
LCLFPFLQQEQKINELQQRLEQVLSDRQAYVKESIEAPSRLAPGPIQPSSSFRASAMVHASDVEQMRAHESKIAELAKELESHASKAAEWESERSVLLAKVSTRDDEVKRLSEVLESERNWDKMHVEFELKRQVKTIAKLQQQIDYLNEQRATWEKDIQSFKEMGVSASYMQQLHTSQQHTQQMETEYQQAVQRIQQLQQQIEAQNQQLDKMEQAKQGVNEHAQEMLEERERQIHELQRKVGLQLTQQHLKATQCVRSLSLAALLCPQYDHLMMENEQRGINIERLATQLDQTKVSELRGEACLRQHAHELMSQAYLISDITCCLFSPNSLRSMCLSCKRTSSARKVRASHSASSTRSSCARMMNS